MDLVPNPPGGRSGAPTRLLAVIALGAAAVLAVAVALAAGDDLAPGEAAVFRALDDLPRPLHDLLLAVMPLGTAVGLAVLVVAALATRRWVVALAAVAAWGVTRELSAQVKDWVGRARPPALLADVVLHQDLPPSPGLTSSHSAIAATLAVVAAWGWPRARWAVLALAGLAGVARIHVGVHLPLDVVAGWALGALVGVTVVAVAGLAAPRRGQETVEGEPHDRWS